MVIAFYRVFFSTLLLAPFAVAAARNEPTPLRPLDLAAFGAIGFFLAAHFATWITSLNLTTVASSVVIVTTESLWVPLGTAYVLRERVAPRVWAGVAIALAGTVILVMGDRADTRVSLNPLTGDFLALAAAIAASLYFLAGRRYRQRVSLLTYATIVYAWCSLFLLAFVAVKHEPLWPYSPRAFAFFLALAVFPMLLGHTLINYLLKWVPPPYVSTSILAEPVVSTVLAVVLLQEALLPLVGIGGAVVLIGVFVGTTSGRRSASSGVETTA